MLFCIRSYSVLLARSSRTQFKLLLPRYPPSKWLLEAWLYGIHITWMTTLILCLSEIVVNRSLDVSLFLTDWVLFSVAGLFVGWPVVLIFVPLIFKSLRTTFKIWL